VSQASDMLAEVKQLVTDVTKEVKSFEGDAEGIGHFTDLAHLNVAKIHLSELLGGLKVRRANSEVPAPTSEPMGEPAPAPVAVPKVKPPAGPAA
jgi:hypothetical protein